MGVQSARQGVRIQRAHIQIEPPLSVLWVQERDAFLTLYPQGYHKTDKLVRGSALWGDWPGPWQRVQAGWDCARWLVVHGNWGRAANPHSPLC